MRHAKGLGQVRWWSAVPVLLVAGGFTVIGIAGDTTRRPVPAPVVMPSKDGGATDETRATNDVRARDAQGAVVRHLPDESRRDAVGRAR